MAKLTALDDRELSDWVMTHGGEQSGDFLCALAEAVMKADSEDYSVIRPALISLRTKYAHAEIDMKEMAGAVTSRRRASGTFFRGRRP
jgi:hypothetical protein